MAKTTAMEAASTMAEAASKMVEAASTMTAAMAVAMDDSSSDGSTNDGKKSGRGR